VADSSYPGRAEKTTKNLSRYLGNIKIIVNILKIFLTDK
jgi:hypothetical protein